MKIDKVAICTTAVNAVKDTARNIGMVCTNCRYLEDWIGKGYVCTLTKSEVHVDGFCYRFEFRDEYACNNLWQKLMKNLEYENIEIIGYSECQKQK